MLWQKISLLLGISFNWILKTFYSLYNKKNQEFLKVEAKSQYENLVLSVSEY